jgi:hypothetical protein
MQKITLYRISGTLALATFILFSLLLFADMPNKKKNGFQRKFNKSAKLLNRSSVEYPLTSIAGLAEENIYFSFKDPRILFVTDYSLNKKGFFNLPLRISMDSLAASTVRVDSPFVELYLNNRAKIITFRFGDSLTRKVKLELPLFSRMTILNGQTIVLRGFDTTRQSQFFQKFDRLSGKFILKNDLLSNNSDAGFSTDGNLLYDKSTNKVLYILSYANSFYCMDSNLNLIYNGKTIDTTNQNNITTAPIYSAKKGTLLPTSPLKKNNGPSCISNGMLFILSQMKADNEDSKAYLNNSVIDVYNIINGNYKCSFYVQNIQDEKIKTFKVKGDSLIAIYPKNIATFQMIF